MKIKLLLIVPVFIISFFQVALGQNDSLINEPPQILTTDLTRIQVVESPKLSVIFVVVDSDLITDITINDEPVAIESGKSVVVKKDFSFEPGKTLIKIIATDESGNSREKSYLVGYAIEKTEVTKSADQKDKPAITWNAQGSFAYEIDDNPSNDLSLPISVGDLEIKGVIPDSEQTDSRTVINGTLSMSLGSYAGFFGISRTAYSKSENEYLGSMATFIGGVYTRPLDDTKKLMVNAMILDINVGGEDFGQNITLAPSIGFDSEDKEGAYKHILGLDYTTKSFANSDLSSGSQLLLKWVYDSTDAEKQDNYHRTFAYGMDNNGTDESEVTFFSFDYDWKNKWKSGFKWDLGMGFQHRTYKNDVPLSTETPLGTNRVDLPLRFSTGMGMEFTVDRIEMDLMYNYKYTFNLSNKSPYVRSIHGLTLTGAF